MLQATFNTYQNAIVQESVKLIQDLLNDIQMGSRMPKLNGERVTFREKEIASYFLDKYANIMLEYTLTDLADQDINFNTVQNLHTRQEMQQLLRSVNRITGLGLNSSADFVLDRERGLLALVSVVSATVTRTVNTTYSVELVIGLFDPMNPSVPVTKVEPVNYSLRRTNVDGLGVSDLLTGTIPAGSSSVTRTLTTTTLATTATFDVALELTSTTAFVGVSPQTRGLYRVQRLDILGDIVLRASLRNPAMRTNATDWTGDISFGLFDSLDPNRRRTANQSITFDVTMTNVNNRGATSTVTHAIPLPFNSLNAPLSSRSVLGTESFTVTLVVSNISGGITLGSGSLSSITVPAFVMSNIIITPSLTLVSRGAETSFRISFSLASAATSNIEVPYRIEGFLDGMNPLTGNVSIASGATSGNTLISVTTINVSAYTITGRFTNAPVGYSFSTDSLTLAINAITEVLRIREIVSTGRPNEARYGLSLTPEVAVIQQSVTNFSVRVSNVDGVGGTQDYPLSIPAGQTFSPQVASGAINIAESVLGNGFNIGLELVNLPTGFIFNRTSNTSASVDPFELNVIVSANSVNRTSATTYNLVFDIHHVQRSDNTTRIVRGRNSTITYQISNANGAGSTLTNTVTFGDDESSFTVTMTSAPIDSGVGTAGFNISVNITNKPSHINVGAGVPLSISVPSV